MLKYLHIENYRLFKSLKIEPLRRVNLITGRNNTGKTAVLEAIRIIESEAEPNVINNIIFKRDDFEEGLYTESSIFYDYNLDSEIALNDIKFHFEFDDNRRRSGSIYSEMPNQKKEKLSIMTNQVNTPNDVSIVIPFDTSFSNIDLWHKINLSLEEDDFLSILQTVEKNIIRVGLDFKTQKPKVLLRNQLKPVPLKHLGDGISRIFTIALGLVNAKNKSILIDEIDLGLHHSVQKKLWEIIFKFSEELNVQVFATTHSHDCVKAFAAVWNQKENIDNGQYFRLTRERSTPSVIYPEYYDYEELLSSIYNLEPR
jgi:AAA15 family ATPase/GTPase